MTVKKHDVGSDPTRPVGNRNPPKATQFGQPDAPKTIGHAWKKADTPRYKLEHMMTLSEAELTTIVDDEESPLFERQIAKAIKAAEWKTLEHMIDQVYGQPAQRIEQTIEAPKPLIDIKTMRKMRKKE